MSEHLTLPFYETVFERKKYRGGGIKPREDRKQFSDIQIFNLGNIKKDFDKDKERFKQFFDPNLLFKIEVNQSVDKDTFANFLAKNKIKVISPSPEGKGYWILLAEDENLDEVKKRLEEYKKRTDLIEYLFSLQIRYRQHLKEGPVNNELSNAFKDNNRKLTSKAKVTYIDNKKWAIRDEMKNYRIEDIGTALYIYKVKSVLIDAIESFEHIPPAEKIGEQLKEKPLQEGKEYYLDIEIWRMETEKLDKFLIGFEKLMNSKNGQITDKLITDNICLLRAKINKSFFEEIITLKEISRIDRPPKPYITHQMLPIALEKFNVRNSPPDGATGIAILDSGILSNHPLLEKAVGDEIAVPLLFDDKIKEDKPQDDVGHGTEVAGIALYGDVKKCIDDKIFQPEVWILSAKIMYKNDDGEEEYATKELLEHQLKKAVEYFTKNYSNFKVVNLSLGATGNRMFGNNKFQFPLATLIDELAKKWDIIFVICAGNLDAHYLSQKYPDEYPNYLIEEKEDVKIIDPASSVYAITVGSIAQEFGPSDIHPNEILFSPAKTNYPSPFTRVGPGYKGMVKPELIEEGGNIILPTDPKKFEDIGSKLIVLNHRWIEDGNLFTVGYGTSLSAPKVAHYVAKLFNYFPNYSTNLIKALLLSSAEIPSIRPPPLDKIKFNDTDTKLMDLLKVYGYGKPNFDRATSSDSNNVLLLAENNIKLDGIHLYYFYLPKEFVETKGEREISVVLVYNPPIAGKISAFGINMEYYLFKNAEIQEIIRDCNKIVQNRGEMEEVIPKELKLKQIDLHPGVSIRKRGIYQKGIKIYSDKPDIDNDKPLVLVVISKNNWLKAKEYLQDYAVVVTVKHKAKIDLYNLIRQQIQQRARIR